MKAKYYNILCLVAASSGWASCGQALHSATSKNVSLSGSQKINHSSETGNLKSAQSFIQPFKSRYMDIAITPRIAFVSRTNQSENSMSQPVEGLPFENRNMIVFEPDITVKGGFQSVALQFKWSHTTFKFDQSNYSPVFDDYFSVCLLFMVSDRLKKQK